MKWVKKGFLGRKGMGFAELFVITRARLTFSNIILTLDVKSRKGIIESNGKKTKQYAEKLYVLLAFVDFF